MRGAPYHPMTQGKIERWHQTLKNRILLENYYLPGDLEAEIGGFVADYNHLRYHESLGNLTPADVYFGRGQTILIERERIKRQTITNRRLLHRRQPHNIISQTSQSLPKTPSDGVVGLEVKLALASFLDSFADSADGEPARSAYLDTVRLLGRDFSAEAEAVVERSREREVEIVH